jgi:hypothetical protein
MEPKPGAVAAAEHTEVRSNVDEEDFWTDGLSAQVSVHLQEVPSAGKLAS